MLNNIGPILKYEPEIINISGNSYISIEEYNDKKNVFYDVKFINNESTIFIGRFIKEFNKIQASYKDGKILVYYDEYNKLEEKCVIVKVLALYDILDDTFYSLKEEEALNVFEPSLNTNYLKTKDRLIVRNDVIKKHILKV